VIVYTGIGLYGKPFITTNPSYRRHFRPRHYSFGVAIVYIHVCKTSKESASQN